MSRLMNATLAVALLCSTATGMSAADAHDHAHDDHGHGAATALGAVTLGTLTATVAAAETPIAGKEWPVTVNLPAGTTAPKAIRIWVGIENGRGSEKAKAEGEAEHPGVYEGHVTVPAPLPEGAKLWISLEPATGDSVKGAVALTATPAAATPAVKPAHDPHAGHKH